MAGTDKHLGAAQAPIGVERALRSLRNAGKAAMADFEILGIDSVAQLAMQNADTLYIRLCQATAKRHDPCVHDVFAATIHEAQTGEPVDWWSCTPARKIRMAAGDFPTLVLPGPSGKQDEAATPEDRRRRDA